MYPKTVESQIGRHQVLAESDPTSVARAADPQTVDSQTVESQIDRCQVIAETNPKPVAQAVEPQTVEPQIVHSQINSLLNLIQNP